jgi:hypothetical protein
MEIWDKIPENRELKVQQRKFHIRKNFLLKVHWEG